MGNRVLIQFVASAHTDKFGQKFKAEFSPVIYGHWYGSQAAEMLVALHRQMSDRGADVSYIAARAIGRMCADSGADGQSTGVGLWNAKRKLTSEDSHGDAGVYIVDVTKADWRVTMLGGHCCERGNIPRGGAVRFIDGEACTNE